MTTLSGKWAIDSQILIYSLDAHSSFYPKTHDLFALINQGKIEPVVAQQNAIESERVLMRVYKKMPTDVVSDLTNILTSFDFEIVTPVGSTYLHFQDLITRVNSIPRDIFDYYLAATLMDNGVSQLLTVNTADFAGIGGFTAVNPFSSL